MTAPAHLNHGRGIRPGTGMPAIDARGDFHRARRAQIATTLLASLPFRRGRRAHPRTLDGTCVISWAGSILRVIPVQAIVGTADPTTDFDADFRPATNRLLARWQRIALAHRCGRPLPPITVIKRPDGYYVVDGRHRVSVARAFGQTDIEAFTTSSQDAHGAYPGARRIMGSSTEPQRKGGTAMALDHRIPSRRKLTASIAAGAAAIAVAIGGYAIADSGSSSTASAATAGKVIPFHRGQPSPATHVGQVPKAFSPGTGTIITGTAANKAKAAALAAYPGGTVNRVVRLSDGEYNVHIIGVNWPHRVFVDQSFKVVGAD